MSQVEHKAPLYLCQRVSAPIILNIAPWPVVVVSLIGELSRTAHRA